jgi:cell division protein FtsL
MKTIKVTSIKFQDMTRVIFALLALTLSLSSCVVAKKKYDAALLENERLEKKLNSQIAESKELKSNLDQTISDYESMKKDLAKAML